MTDNSDGTLGTPQAESAGPSCNTRRRARAWSYTYNNPTMNDDEMLELMKTEDCEYAFQLEKGESGTIHYQGTLRYKNPREFESVRKIIKGAHFEESRNWRRGANYCVKVETRIGTPHTNIEWLKIPKAYIIEKPNITLRPWQERIMEIIKEKPDDRTVYWVYDKVGNSGKTVFAKWLKLTYPKRVFYVCGKANDMKFLMTTRIKEDEIEDSFVIIMDLPRSVEDHVSYQGLEELKNGFFFSGKYESKETMYNPPHLFVFANFKPAEEKLSRDRWDVWEL